jgi:hypothetical protein
MSGESTLPGGAAAETGAGAAPQRPLTPAAERALAEAEERRRRAAAAEPPPERGGPSGPEPTRFGDWERRGRAYDF